MARIERDVAGDVRLKNFGWDGLIRFAGLEIVCLGVQICPDLSRSVQIRLDVSGSFPLCTAESL